MATKTALPVNPKLRRLASIERQLQTLNDRFDKVLALQAQNAVLASMNRRLIGEKEKLLESLEILKQARKA